MNLSALRLIVIMFLSMRSIGCGYLMAVEWQFVEFRVDHIRAKSSYLYTWFGCLKWKIDVDLKKLIFLTLSSITTNDDWASTLWTLIGRLLVWLHWRETGGANLKTLYPALSVYEKCQFSRSSQSQFCLKFVNKFVFL